MDNGAPIAPIDNNTPNNTPPTTQAPAPSTQPGATTPQPGVTTPQPGVTTPQPGLTTPQPGVTTPNNGGQDQEGLAGPVQPGVTAPRVAPLPVPGQSGQSGPAQPAIMPEPGPGQPGQPQPVEPGQPQPGQETAPGTNSPANGPTQQNTQSQPTQYTAPSWSSPSLRSAPAAPIVHMTGPHTEVGANIDGGGLLPGYVANTHHFNNANGYVGTVGYRTPQNAGDAGISIEYVQANQIKVTTYTHTTGLAALEARTGIKPDVKNTTFIDTTQANAAKAAVEGWIRMQPGGVAAIDAAAQVGKLPAGNYAPKTVNVAGATAQVSGSVQN